MDFRKNCATIFVRDAQAEQALIVPLGEATFFLSKNKLLNYSRAFYISNSAMDGNFERLASGLTVFASSGSTDF